MATSLKNLSEYNDQNIPTAKGMSFGIVISDWNSDITHTLHQGALDTLLKHGVDEQDIKIIQVPGSFELPMGARMLLKANKLNAVICLGCVIKGETTHNEYINQSVASALQTLSLTSGIPCIFGLLTPNDHQQAVHRAGGKHGNKGVEAAVTAIRMAALAKDLNAPKNSIGFGIKV